MISLAECLLLLARSDEDKSKEYGEEAKALLEQLIVVDPDRKNRYHDMIQSTPYMPN
jgi:hypothetical protein